MEYLMGNLRDLQSICLPTICVTIFHIFPDHRRGSPLSLIIRVSSFGSPLSLITRVSSQSHHSGLLSESHHLGLHSVSLSGSPLGVSSDLEHISTLWHWHIMTSSPAPGLRVGFYRSFCQIPDIYFTWQTHNEIESWRIILSVRICRERNLF